MNKTKNIFDQILGEKDTKPKPRKVNAPFKRWINKILNKDIFSKDEVKPTDYELYLAYNAIFDANREDAVRVITDIAEAAGFFNWNSPNEARRVFFHIMKRITIEPPTK